MDIMKFVVEQALVLIPALWIIGAFLKNTPSVPDWVIPYVLLTLGIVGAVGIMGLSVQSIVQGVLVSGAAVLGHQLIKQAQSANEEKPQG